MQSRRVFSTIIVSLGATAAVAWLWKTMRDNGVTDRILPMLSAAELSPVPAGGDRVAAARAHVEKSLREDLRSRGIVYPPAQMYLRAFKQEKELEIWAGGKSEPLQLIETMPILAASGELGPKRKEGDRQVPEGFYEIDLFNPKSSYHLSMRVNYPNASDRVLSDKDAPGSDIYVHGKNVSIGCLAMGDENIERLYVLAEDAHKKSVANIPIHIFPARMKGTEWEQLRDAAVEKNPALGEFWKPLEEVYEKFERSHQVPVTRVLEDGTYEVRGERHRQL